MAKILWRAYCVTCAKELAVYLNGPYVEAVALGHAKEHGHEVMVGYLVPVEEKEV